MAVGPETADQKEAKILNRIITLQNYSINYEADPRHAEIIIDEFGLSEAKSLSVPASKGTFHRDIDRWSRERIMPSQNGKHRRG